MPLDIAKIRADFPILQQQVHAKPLIYLDNAATTQLPLPVWRAMERFYTQQHANPHRSSHALAVNATEQLEQARYQVARFINAADTCEIIFCNGASDAINLLAWSFENELRNQDAEIVISIQEHHSNWVPWQQLCQRTGARLKIIPLTDTGDLDLAAYQELLSDQTRLVAVTHVSNVLGTVNPISQLTSMAHQRGIPVVVDGAQSIRHEIIDVTQLGCDFFCFSGHKTMAPTGIGVLYGRRNWLEKLAPGRFGGGMIKKLTPTTMTYEPLPHKFEAGTVNCAGAVALATALKYHKQLGRKNIQNYEQQLLNYCREQLTSLPDLEIVGSPRHQAGVLSLIIRQRHCYDITTMLDKLGIAVRSGQHCAQPLLNALGLAGTVRISPAYYNTVEEIDQLINAMAKIIHLLPREPHL